MTVEPDEKWYYSGAGVTIGPMSFDDLRARAASTSLQPPMELVRSTKMDEWKQVADIPGLRVVDTFSLPESSGEMMQGDWYYVAGAEQLGPVTLRVIEEMVEKPDPGRPLRMVWTVGMKQWLPVNEVEALSGALNKVRQRELDRREQERQLAREKAEAEQQRRNELQQENSANLRDAARKAMEMEEAKSMAEREERLRAAALSRARAKALMQSRLAPAPLTPPGQVDEAEIERRAREKAAAEARMKAEAGQALERKDKKAGLVNTIRHFLRKKPVQPQDLSVMAAKAKEEEAAKRAEEERRWQLELEQLNKAKEERRLRLEAEARRQAEEQQIPQQEDTSLVAEQESQRMAEQESQRMAEQEEARRMSEQEEAKRMAEQQEAKRLAEEEARRAAEEEKRRLEEEARRKVEEEKLRKEEEARLKAEEEAREAQEARQRAEEEAKILAEANARAERQAKAAAEAKARVEAQLRLAEEAKRRAEEAAREAEESRRRAEAAARAKAEEAERLKSSKDKGDAGDSSEQQVEQAELAKKQAEDELEAAEKAKAEADEMANVSAVEEERLRSEAKEKEIEEARAKEEAETKSKENEQAAKQIEILKKAEEQRKAFAAARAAHLQKMADAQREIDEKMGVKPKADGPSNKTTISAIQEARKIAMITSKTASTSTIKPSPKPGEAGAAANKVAAPKAKEIESGEVQPPAAEVPAEPTGDPLAVWYYTQGSEKLGPVTFETLREMAEKGSLSPRMDMVWKSDGGSWEPAGGVEGLFQREKAAAKRAAKKEARAGKLAKNKRKLPSPGSLLQYGVPRATYVPMVLFFPLLWPWCLQLTLDVAGGMIPADMRLTAEHYGVYAPIVVFLLLTVSRLANVGMNRAWVLGMVLPVLNLWIGFRCFACPAHYETYRKLDGPGLMLAILYWAIVVPIIVGLTALALVAFGYVGGPELQEQWRSIWDSLPIGMQAPVRS